MFENLATSILDFSSKSGFSREDVVYLHERETAGSSWFPGSTRCCSPIWLATKPGSTKGPLRPDPDLLCSQRPAGSRGHGSLASKRIIEGMIRRSMTLAGRGRSWAGLHHGLREEERKRLLTSAFGVLCPIICALLRPMPLRPRDWRKRFRFQSGKAAMAPEN